ncbi:MAG: hypothetical protein A2381_14470 [Bdellovibrionales bacterium RIFOXYB1_FULL_37_110]|nr:MAG: hypothetical protein A2417_03130 [Bdellovibrionales bacterium RIFOXYC1_FULL_37_79]OFZ58344.1 MAG: hypothetical protein A2381_14470 [Bdellovibrionales bacterium RIFOXYB1_FULL_37_110]OFZ62682.1 MAG: hypothetical protein A2577_02180 [Bdellovibrionales bacterium RIFOXYD1_FULL_36_51]
MLRSLFLVISTIWVMNVCAEAVLIQDWTTTSEIEIEGVTISFSYQKYLHTYMSNKPHTWTTANPVFINVSGGIAADAREIRVVLNNDIRGDLVCGLMPNSRTEGQIVDLKRATEGHFYAQLESIILTDVPYCHNEYSVGQRVAIVIDGKWLPEFNASIH